MSFTCYATKKVVENEPMVLVPIVVRKVKYIGFVTKKSYHDEEPKKFITGESIGFEIVKEVPVAQSEVDQFLVGFKPEERGEKVLEFYRPRKKVVEEKKDYRDYDRDPKYFDSIEEEKVETIKE
jgi:hypothetical protein